MSPSTDYAQTALDQLRNADNLAVTREEQLVFFLSAALVNAQLGIATAIREASLNDIGDSR